MICISIGDETIIPEVNRIKPSLVEVRYDLLSSAPALVSGKIEKEIQQVATCRPGKYSDVERLKILKEALEYGAAFVDVEIDSDEQYIAEIKDLVIKRNAHLIFSYHNFENTPGSMELKQILDSCYDKGGDTAKIATMVHSESDIARLLSLYAHPGSKVLIGMGEKGRISRIAALELGALFTFASVNKEQVTAPGQLTYAEMESLRKIIHQ
ncbi:MAG: type I 3-dehydroquinate dehydratase [Bacteroidales bacterium]|nr:type I 3-dehydroquinate dehydratase [Bacteroidales bacterium]